MVCLVSGGDRGAIMVLVGEAVATTLVSRELTMLRGGRAVDGAILMPWQRGWIECDAARGWS